MPIGAGLLAIGSAVVGRDLYAEGRTFENLGIASLNPAALKEVLHEGVSMLGRHNV
jgi:opine dehydrogenase